MIVEFYRCWPGNQGDSGTWDTDTIEIPDGSAKEDILIACEAAAADLVYQGKPRPLFVGVYSILEQG